MKCVMYHLPRRSLSGGITREAFSSGGSYEGHTSRFDIRIAMNKRDQRVRNQQMISIVKNPGLNKPYVNVVYSCPGGMELFRG